MRTSSKDGLNTVMPEVWLTAGVENGRLPRSACLNWRMQHVLVGQPINNRRQKKHPAVTASWLLAPAGGVPVPVRLLTSVVIVIVTGIGEPTEVRARTAGAVSHVDEGGRCSCGPPVWTAALALASCFRLLCALHIMGTSTAWTT